MWPEIKTLEELYAGWQSQIEAIAAKADRWLTFSAWCAWIGFGISLVALVWLIVIIRRTDEKEN